MKTVDDLIDIFNAGNFVPEEVEESTFSGDLFAQKGYFEKFSQIRKFEISKELEKYLKAFSGTILFKDEYENGFIVFPLNDIEKINLEMQATTDKFFPKYVFIAEDFRGDLIAIRDGKEFGWLDHEAFGEVDIWDNEAFNSYNFDEWLNNFINKGGETLL